MIRPYRYLREAGTVECDHCRGSGQLPDPLAWRRLRKALRLTLKDVAADGLFSIPYLSELERGRKAMTWQHANDLADIYLRLGASQLGACSVLCSDTEARAILSPAMQTKRFAGGVADDY